MEFTLSDKEDLMGALRHLAREKEHRQSDPGPRLISSTSGTCLDQEEVLLLEAGGPTRRRSVTVQGLINTKINRRADGRSDDSPKRIIASTSGNCLYQEEVLLIENGGDSKRRRSLSSIKKRDSIINRSEAVDDGGLPPRMISSPCGKVLPQGDVKLLMSPSSVAADHKHFDSPVPFVL